MIKSLDFVYVPVQDMARAISFYQDGLGLQRPRGLENKWMEFDVGGATLALVRPEAYGMKFVAAVGGGIGMGVDDVQQAVDALMAKGMTIPGGVNDTGVCHMAFLTDSEGNTLVLHKRYAPE